MSLHSILIHIYINDLHPAVTQGKKQVIIDAPIFQRILHWYHAVSASCILPCFSPTSSTTSLAQVTRAFTRDAKRSISSLGSPLSVVKTFWLQLLGRLSKATARGLVKGGIFRRSLVIWRVKHLQTKGSLWLDGSKPC